MRVHVSRIFVSTAIFVLSAGAVCAQEKDLALKSPDGELTMRFAVRTAEGGAQAVGRLVYSLDFRGKAVFEDSALGLDLDGAELLGSNVHVTGSDLGDGVDEYALATGKTSKVREEYRSLMLRVAESWRKGTCSDD